MVKHLKVIGQWGWINSFNYLYVSAYLLHMYLIVCVINYGQHIFQVKVIWIQKFQLFYQKDTLNTD